MSPPGGPRRYGMVFEPGKPSQKPVLLMIRYPRRVPTLLVSVWFRLRERASVKSGRRCVLTVMVVEPTWRPAQVWWVRHANQVKPSQKSVPPTVLHWTGPRCVALVLSPGGAFRTSRFDCWYGMWEAVAVYKYGGCVCPFDGLSACTGE